MGTTRSRISAALLALATSLAGSLAGIVVVLAAAPAQAGWTEVDGLVRQSICKQGRPQAWTFLTRVRKRAGTEDARAGMSLHIAGEQRQRWSSGWLRDRELDRGWVRYSRAGRVRVQVWQEAGDRDSGVGTAQERRVLRPRQITRC